jgi:hypothetical protein
LSRPARRWGDQQDRATLGGGQQVVGERRRGLRFEVGGGLVEVEHREVGQQRAGQGQPLALAARDPCALLADQCVPAVGQRADPVEDAGAGGGRLQRGGGRGRAGQPEVLADGGVEQVGVLGGQPDDAADVRGRVLAQVVAVQRGQPAVQLPELLNRRVAVVFDELALASCRRGGAGVSRCRWSAQRDRPVEGAHHWRDRREPATIEASGFVGHRGCASNPQRSRR